MAFLDRAIASNPHLLRAWSIKIDILKSLGRADEGIEAFDELLAHVPEDPYIWTAKAELIASMGDLAGALTTYDEASEALPQSALPWANKGRVLMQCGRNEESLHCFERAVSIDDQLATAWCDLGVCHLNLGHTIDALVCYDKAIAIDPTDPLPWNNKGWTFYLEARYAEATACFDRSLALDAQQSEAWWNRGLSLMASEQLDTALVSFDKALELSPGAIVIRRSRIEVLVRLGRVRDASAEEKQIAKLEFEASNASSGTAGVLTLAKLQSWAVVTNGEAALTGEEIAYIDRRTDASCDRFGWPDLGKKFDQSGDRELCRNLAFLMLRKEMSFRSASFEYTAALERGSRRLAPDDVLDDAYTDMCARIRSLEETGSC
jgi:tetratricopeptide (TPR) repeat protein